MAFVDKADGEHAVGRAIRIGSDAVWFEYYRAMQVIAAVGDRDDVEAAGLVANSGDGDVAECVGVKRIGIKRVGNVELVAPYSRASCGRSQCCTGHACGQTFCALCFHSGDRCNNIRYGLTGDVLDGSNLGHKDTSSGSCRGLLSSVAGGDNGDGALFGGKCCGVGCQREVVGNDVRSYGCYGGLLGGETSTGLGRCVDKSVGTVGANESGDSDASRDVDGFGSGGRRGEFCGVGRGNVERRFVGGDEFRGDDVGQQSSNDRGIRGVELSNCGGTSAEFVGVKTLANREKRAKKKERKLRKQADQKADGVPEWRRGAKSNVSGYRGAFEMCDEETRRKLAETRAKRLIIENEACVRKAQVESERWTETVRLQRKQDNLKMLKVGKQIEALRSSGVETIQEDLEQRRLSQQLKIAQSRQKLELVAAQDIEGLKRRQASKVLRDTETNKVAVERAFGTLASTGNVPSCVGGKVYTVNSGSISPNSSASEAEVRAMQKEVLDLRKQNEELLAKLGQSKVSDYGEYEYSEGITIDEDGHPIGDFGDAYSGYIGKDNRFHFGESMMPYFD